MPARLGLNARLYLLPYDKRGEAGVLLDWPAGGGVPPELILYPSCMDITLNLSKAEADVTTRASNGWRQSVGTLKDGEVSFDVLYNPANPIAYTDPFQNLLAAWLYDYPICLAVMDQAYDTVGAQGFYADFTVITFEKQEALEDAQKVSVSCKPTPSVLVPQWVTTVATP